MTPQSGPHGPVRRRLYIHGRVQGVFFRDSAREMASAFGVTGWVRNLPDGRVEVVAEGERDRVELLTQWCRRGPDTALVEAVDVLEEPYKGEFQMFTIERTLR